MDKSKYYKIIHKFEDIVKISRTISISYKIEKIKTENSVKIYTLCEIVLFEINLIKYILMHYDL
jgi:hypothetical protein